SEFMIALDQQRTIVSERFAAAVVGQSEQPVDVLAAVWKADPGSAEAGRQIQALGFESAATVQGKLKVLHDSAQYRHLDTRGRKRFDALIPRILRLAAKQEDAAETVYRLLNILVAVGRRSAYFALLNENPQVLERLAGLCAQSSWLASQVASHPILLDELIDPRLFESLPTRADFSADLQRRFAAIQQQDLEAEMEALRRFQQAAVFRVAVADLSGVLPLMKVSDRLTDVAELVLEKTLQLARTEMQARYGRPRCGEPGDMREVGFAVIGYGKLGGLELGYASDLDLVFLHDGAGSVQQTDGKAGLDNARYFARLGQRILHILGTTTAAGVLYEVDTRLRPSGKGGSMVSSIASFDNYQQQSAWTWEHQALLRARAVAGDRSVSEAFETIRQRVLAKARDPAVLKDEVLSMRQRMRRELAGGGAGVFNIKRDRGGLTDLEFLVQYWVLANAETQPAMLRWSDNIRQLEELANAAIVPAEMAARLTDIYRQYRQRLHRLALANKDKCVPEQEFAGQRQQICEVWCSVFGE
ncbi:MAG: bifunctional [glutamate--ammonia ligase]-adenylyl-L-tyrosine phosphorylase/[glutamate--ammonia-ligase] adenylyltransferase, partial [Gammaproteobacteria bacterium]|nr:bifunctional [glutamate--ammonia ligase]-adenylyl-L-tyrosine phosphorylase/[glutamate--ammonia-ligase] adenylyltransferase [Gammaproteobacteria bacterium]